MESGPPNERQRVEDLWRIRLDEAHKNYNLAVAEARTAGADFHSRQLPTPDGSANLVNALRTERVARDEYMRVLRIFTDLVAHGKRPEE